MIAAGIGQTTVAMLVILIVSRLAGLW